MTLTKTPVDGPHLRKDRSHLGVVLLITVWLSLAQSEASVAGQPPSFVDGGSNPFGLAAVSNFPAPSFADLDGDGDLDAFIGDNDGNIAFSENTGTATSPAFAPATDNPFGLVNVGARNVATFADLDGDGDLDAIVGNRDGYTVSFENTGTATNPAFAAPTKDYGLSITGLGLTKPSFADLDGDGDLDAFVGTYGPYGASTWYFENTGTATSPAFADRVANPFGLTSVTEESAPSFADLDGDGDLDAFIGETAYSLWYFENTGTATSPAFAAKIANPFGLVGIDSYSIPTFADLDGDGDLDLFVGHTGGDTDFFENVSEPTGVVFSAAADNPFGLTDVGDLSKPTLADLDGDGDLDAFLGGSDGATRHFENTGTAISPAFAAAVVNPFGLEDVGDNSAPRFVDLDADGDLDALIGEGNGNIFFSMNTGTATAPAFADSIINPFGLSDVGSDSTPSFVDLNGDGKLDAFIGNSSGDTVHFSNIGSATAPDFLLINVNLFGLTNVGAFSAPSFADVDGDGDLDAFIGESTGNTVFFRNTGSSSSPAFAAGVNNPFGLANVGAYSAPSFADLDGDGDLEAFIGESEGDVKFFDGLDPSLFFDGFESGDTSAWAVAR